MADIDTKYETRIVDLATHLAQELPNLPKGDETTGSSLALLLRSHFIDSQFRKRGDAKRNQGLTRK